MKAKNNLSGFTLEELQEKQKKTKGVIFGVVIVMLISLSYVAYVSINDENYALLILVFTLPITLLPIFIHLSQLNSEIKSRNSI